MKTFLFHIHTEKSPDSSIKIPELVDFVIRNKIDYFCVTDHHNFEGCEIIEELLQKEKYYGKTNLIKGVEITTEYGDIIPCFIQKEIKTRKFLEVVKETKQQKGLLFLPHPYKFHKELDYIVQYVDGMEIWNSACTKSNNRKAAQLASWHPQLLKISGVDAHSVIDLPNALNEIRFGRKIEITPTVMKGNGYVGFHIRYLRNRLLNTVKYR